MPETSTRRALAALALQTLLAVAASAQEIPDPYSGDWIIGTTRRQVMWLPPPHGTPTLNLSIGGMNGALQPGGLFSVGTTFSGCSAGLGGYMNGRRMVASEGILCPPTVPEPQITPTSGIHCECRDGNTRSGDGCDARCQVEPCFTCIGTSCTPSPNGAACDDRNACTTGETCAAGVCGGGAPVVPCANLTGQWIEHTEIPALGVSTDAIVDIAQIGSDLEYGPSSRLVPLRLGVIDPQSGALVVRRATGGALSCNMVETVSGTATMDGASYVVSGTFFGDDPTACDGVPMMITATRCDGPCVPTTTTTITTTTTTTTTTLPQLVAGKALTLGDDANAARRKLTLKAGDTILDLGLGDGSADDPTLHGATLRVRGTTFDVTYALPAAGWTRLGAAGGNAGYRYKDAALAVGPVRDVTVRPGRLLKIAAKGAGLGHTLASDPRPVDVVVALGGRHTCLRFGGTVSVKPGRSYKATRAPRPAACAP